MTARRVVHIGGWRLTIWARADIWHWALGGSAALLSWRSAYPWLIASVGVGPFAFGLDAVRPDAVALEMGLYGKEAAR